MSTSQSQWFWDGEWHSHPKNKAPQEPIAMLRLGDDFNFGKFVFSSMNLSFSITDEFASIIASAFSPFRIPPELLGSPPLKQDMVVMIESGEHVGKIGRVFTDPAPKGLVTVALWGDITRDFEQDNLRIIRSLEDIPTVDQCLDSYYPNG